MFQSQLLRQEQKKKLFVDDNLRKERKIQEHVNINYDKDVFHHESDRYQQHQHSENDRTLAFREWQKQQKSFQVEGEKQQKSVEHQQRLEYQRYLQALQMAEKQQKIDNQFKYLIDLQKLVNEKAEINRKRPEPTVDHKRHNPITNPIEYHIENPYILKRFQQF